MSISFHFKALVIARCAKRAAAIQLDFFVAVLLAMTGEFQQTFAVPPFSP